ncbi:MAG: acyl carrier protein [Acidobacteriota bacterium]
MQKEQIHSWFRDNLSDLLQCGPEEIDASKEIASFGLSSISVVTLAGDLEDWLGKEISPNLLWEHPTLNEVVDHLVAEGAEPA